MAFTAVQRKAKGASAASITIGSADGWATPTAGNLLVVTGNGDANPAMTSTGYTAGPALNDGNGVTTWWKIAAGTETSIVMTPAVTAHCTVTACEYSGFGTGVDVSNSSVANTSGTVTVAANITTTGVSDLIVGFALLHGSGSAINPTAASWTNSFVQVLQGDSGTTASQSTHTLVGELLDSGATGVKSTVASWTGAFTDRQHVIMSFKAGAGAPATVWPPRARRSHPSFRR